MRKLLHANFNRLKKSKIFWGGMIAMTAFGLVLLFNGYDAALRYDIPLPHMFADSLFQSTILMGIVFAVFCSLFIGTEYDNGTIRNKLMIGQSRISIYLSNSVCCITAGFLQVASDILAVLAAGLLLEGVPEMTAGHFFQVSVVMLFTCVSYMSIYNLFAMLVTSKPHAATVNILLAFALLLFASYLISCLNQPEMIPSYYLTAEGIAAAEEQVPNPSYISGTKRAVFEFLIDFLPGGQNYQLINYEMQMQLFHHPVLLCFYSSVIAAVTNIIGIFMFYRKDIK